MTYYDCFENGQNNCRCDASEAVPMWIGRKNGALMCASDPRWFG